MEDQLKLYKAKRIDEGHDIDWGENQGIVFCCTESQVEVYITKYLLTNQVNQSAQSTIDSRDLTMDDIELTELGTANHQLKEGIILIDNVGT